MNKIYYKNNSVFAFGTGIENFIHGREIRYSPDRDHKLTIFRLKIVDYE